MNYKTKIKNNFTSKPIIKIDLPKAMTLSSDISFALLGTKLTAPTYAV